MATAPTVSRVSVEQYLALPDREWQKYELSDGELVSRYGEESCARVNHNFVRDMIVRRLGNYLEENANGNAVAEQDFRLSDTVIRRPDVSFVRQDRIGMFAGDPPVVDGYPDLAVEVISPTEKVLDVDRKLDQLFDAGCQVIWMVIPRDHSAWVCHPGRREKITPGGSLEAPEILPGFQLPIAEIFAPLPGTSE